MNNQKPITVIVVEDDMDFLEGICFCLNEAPSIEVIGRYTSGKQAVRGILAETPDVTLIDIGLPDISGIDVIKEIVKRHVRTEFLVLSVYDDDQHVFQALKSGAVGYIVKNDAAIFSEAVKAIENVVQGGAPMSLGIARRILDEFRTRNKKDIRLTKLTPREMEILEYLSKGYNTKKVAGTLCISYETVRCHQKNIYKKCRSTLLLKR